MNEAHYEPPWADTSIIGIAGSSGSGKTSLALKIIQSLNLPWVIILSMDSFYKVLTAQQSAAAFRNEFDFDAPSAIDFDILVEKLRDLKQGKRAEIPVYSFEKHSREKRTVSIYSPHVLVLEGIFALHDPRIRELLDLKIFAEADADVCLARRIERDVRERGRDMSGCIKQWLNFVKPNFFLYVQPQRDLADIIIPRGYENKIAIDMIVEDIQRKLFEKSKRHQADLARLGKQAQDEALSPNVLLLSQSNQIKAMDTILRNPTTSDVDFLFYFDRLATLIVERALENLSFRPTTITTPLGHAYAGLASAGFVSAIFILRAGSCFAPALRRVLPDCPVGHLLIKTNYRTGEPELHYQRLVPGTAGHAAVLVLDPQMSSGGAALMAVKVLVDHGVSEERIVFVTYTAGKMGVNRLLRVFPRLRLVVCNVVKDYEERWVARRYFRC